MRPVLEHRLVDALRLAQVIALVCGNAGIQNMMVAALDDVDGVDLHVAEVLDGGLRRLRAVAERRARVEPLRAQPDAPGAGWAERKGVAAVRDMSGREFSANRIGARLAATPAGSRAAFVAFGLLLGQASGLRAAEDVATCAALEAGPTRTVTRIIDGETLALDDGTELRLAGTLAPRAIDVGAVPGTWRMETAAIDALQAFVLGKTIEIRFAGERNDRYGRIKGHAVLKTDDGAGWVPTGRATC